MRIEFRSLSGQSHTLSAGETALVKDIRPPVSRAFSIQPGNLVLVHRGSVLADTAKLSCVAPAPNEVIIVYDSTMDPNNISLPVAEPEPERAAVADVDRYRSMSRHRQFPPEIAIDIMRRRFPQLSLSAIVNALRESGGDPVLAEGHLRHFHHEGFRPRARPDNPEGSRDRPQPAREDPEPRAGYDLDTAEEFVVTPSEPLNLWL